MLFTYYFIQNFYEIESSSHRCRSWVSKKLNTLLKDRSIARQAGRQVILAEFFCNYRAISLSSLKKFFLFKQTYRASGLITSWEIDMETVSDFIFGGSKITADGDCSHEIKSLLLGRKVMTNLDSILKSRDITLPTKVRLVKAMVFPVVMYGCKIWTVKKAERQRTDAFELWCWRRLLRVPWTARRSDQSILKISPGCSLEGLTLKLKLQYFSHLMQRVDSLERTLMLGGIGGRRRRGRQRMRWLDGTSDWWTWVWVNSRSWWWTRPGVLQFMGSQKVGHNWATELTDWPDRAKHNLTFVFNSIM